MRIGAAVDELVDVVLPETRTQTKRIGPRVDGTHDVGSNIWWIQTGPEDDEPRMEVLPELCQVP